MLKDKKHIHFIGIGGIGMSGIASYLHSKNYKITGSDQMISENTERLINEGIEIFIGHKKENIENPDLVIFTSAISDDNIELQNAIAQGIQVLSRAELLNEVCKLTKYSIAVAGTHGKTSTTSLIGFIFKEAGLNPVIISGGIIKNYNTNFISGSDFVTIVEADEYDHSFMNLHPDYSIITNIDIDHLECYGTLENIKQNFTQFANQAKSKVILSGDDKNIDSIAADILTNTVFYSSEKKSDFYAQEIDFHNTKTIFRLNEKEVIILPLPGIHNVRNTLAAIAVAQNFGISITIIQEALLKYQGVKRRFEILHEDENYILIDDYAHHPNEIATTLAGAKNAWVDRKILAIFQPHLFSRTQYFYKEFAIALAEADKVVITDIYPAREIPIPGVSGKLIFDELQKLKLDSIAYAEKTTDWLKKINSLKEPGDIIISFGAGDINKIHKQILSTLET